MIGHVSPEAFLGGPIALVEDGDTIVVDLNDDRLDCRELDDTETLERRSAAWNAAVGANGGIHPDAVAGYAPGAAAGCGPPRAPPSSVAAWRPASYPIVIASSRSFRNAADTTGS